jgi:hypothetical protein
VKFFKGKSMFVVMNHRVSQKKIQEMYPDAIIIDVTSHRSEPWIRFSPFYPHGNIPIAYSPGWASASVEGIWQGLKVFEHADIDIRKFTITTMKNLKRSVRTYGNVLGHRKGVEGTDLLSYIDARYLIYLPSYHWVLTHSVPGLLIELKEMAKTKTVVFLDYETNKVVDDISRPLSHAALIQLYLEEKWPRIKVGIKHATSRT